MGFSRYIPLMIFAIILLAVVVWLMFIKYKWRL